VGVRSVGARPAARLEAHRRSVVAGRADFIPQAPMASTDGKPWSMIAEACMTSPEDPDSGAEAPTGDDLQRLVILAYTRLFLLPEREDGSKLTTVMSLGRYDLRLIEVPIGTTGAVPPLWIELYDRYAGRVIDSAGCWDLHDADLVAEMFLTEARSLHGIRPTRDPG
jgi:hypothetical protein